MSYDHQLGCTYPVSACTCDELLAADRKLAQLSPGKRKFADENTKRARVRVNARADEAYPKTHEERQKAERPFWRACRIGGESKLRLALDAAWEATHA